jgi:hypothetical protein
MNDNDTTDPLKNADIGETERIENTVTIHGIDVAPDDCFGNDRLSGDLEVTDVRVVENEWGNEDVEIVIGADVTKQLPKRWDQRAAPVTAEEKQQARRKRWLRRGGKAVATLLPIAAAGLIATTVMQSMSGTINGEPITPPSTVEVMTMLGVVTLVAAIIVWGLNGGFPGMVKPRQR